MTSTLSPSDTGEIATAGEGTRDLTYRLRPPTFDHRRPPLDMTGEQPVYQPPGNLVIGGQSIPLADTGTLVGVAELARLQIGETLVLPVDAEPAPPRHAVATVYMPAPAVDLAAVMPEPERRRDDYRARHRVRPELSPWLLLVLALIAGFAGGVTAVTVAFVQAAIR